MINLASHGTRLWTSQYAASWRCVRVSTAFSLLEVILALAILGGALAVLGEVARMAMRNAGRARDLAQAQLLCEAKMAEILAGVEPPSPIADVPLQTGQVPDWLYSIDVSTLDVDGLIEVRVSVGQDLPPEKQPVRWTLVRWMVDPLTVVETDLVAEAEAASSTTSRGGTSAQNQAGSASGGQAGGARASGSGSGQGSPSDQRPGGSGPAGPTPPSSGGMSPGGGGGLSPPAGPVSPVSPPTGGSRGPGNLPSGQAGPVR